MFVLEVLLRVPVTSGMNTALDTDTGSAYTNAALSNTLTSYYSGGKISVMPSVKR